MGRKEKISHWQLTSIIAGFLIGTAIIFSFTQNYAKRDAWIAELVSAVAGLILLLVIGYIVNKFPEMEVEDILKMLFNPVLARILVVPFFIYAFLLAILALNEIEAFMSNMVMQETPSWVFILTLALTVGIIIGYGIEVFARCTEIALVIILVFASLLMILALRLINFRFFLPVFTDSCGSILKATIVSSFFPYLQSGLLFFLAVHIKKMPEKIFRTNTIGLIIASLFLLLRPICIIGVFGTESGSDLVYPIFSLVRQVNLGGFLERVELIMLIVWFLSIFVKLGVCIFVAVKSLQIIFNLQDYKKLVMPLVLLMVPLGLKAYDNYQEPQILITTTWPLINIPLQVVPIMLTFIACLYKSSTMKS